MNRVISILTIWMRSLPLHGEEGWGRTPLHNGAHGRHTTLDITTPPTASHELGGSARNYG
jgi:hypothetical protein